MKRFLLVAALVLGLSATASACGPGGFGFGVSQFNTFGGGGFGTFGVQRFGRFGRFGGTQINTFSAGPGFGGFQQTEIRRGPFGRQVIRQQSFGF